MKKVIGIFPTPLMKIDRLIKGELLERLRAQALDSQKQSNAGTQLLAHTGMMNPKDNSAYSDLCDGIYEDVVDFGALMFGEKLPWKIKEMWLNVLEPGGSQFMHTHANSFISGIVYLTRPHSSATTMFTRSMGGHEFIFKNESSQAEVNPFNTDKWLVPEIEAGDLVLFPSYILHGVPPNEGERRMTVAFNAIPERLNSWDYEVGFS